MERRLTAILAADVVGYSRIMEQDEAATLAALKTHREQLIDPAIADRHGRIVKLMGDGTLVEFASVVDAVACAAEIQREMHVRNREVPKDRRIELRIGVHLGDVMIDGEDLYGDGVNVAARLEGLAEPGGICISQQAYDQIETKLDLAYENLGEQQVKNIARPVRAYRVLIDGRPPAAAARRRWGLTRPRTIGAALAVLFIAVGIATWWRPWSPDIVPASIERYAFPLPEKPSIAVLAFDNLSGDPEQDYWIDGTTEAIITALSKTPNLFVIARNSTFTYKGQAVKVREIAEEFGVRYVLEGSIQRTGDRVRVNAQLIDGLSGRHVWAEQFDRTFDDLFALQDDLKREVVTALEVELTEGEQARIWRRQTDNQKAYELFRKALVMYRHRNKADNQEARRLFTAAAAADPNFADATCNLGFTYFRAGINGWERPRGEAFGKGRELAEQAIALNPDYPHAYALLGAIATWDNNSDLAIDQFQKSLELEPNYSANVAGYAEALVYAGRGAEAVEQIERAMRLSPYYSPWYLFVAGNAYRMAGRMDDALAAFEKRVERAPKSTFAKMWLAGLYAVLGRQEDAEALMAKARKGAAWLTLQIAGRYLPYRDAAEREAILESLRKAGLPEK